MPQFLDVAYKEKDRAKALGAKFDSGAKRWYVPDGIGLAPFKEWLPSQLPAAPSPVLTPSIFPASPPSPTVTGQSVTVPVKGISLSTLLTGVANAVAAGFKSGVWTMVEVVQVRTNGGHVYLELSERDATGNVIAKANATIWATTANKILPAFEKATGASLAPGIKLLVRAKPIYKPQHGFSLEIDAIDPEYTLGDLEARKREIRTRLTQEGVFEANKKLPAPWDFNNVLVIAPQRAAGLGDFQAEAKRLEQFGICRFVYATSLFQGDGAAAQIRTALLDALKEWNGPGPDAVAIIRGGGAANDLAWLNDYALARAICDLRIPVFTGIGHERDNTVLDEVAHTRFDTPSKVVAGIEQVIQKRTQEAADNFELLSGISARNIAAARGQLEKSHVTVQAGAMRHLAFAKQETTELMSDVRFAATQTINVARQESRDLVAEVRHEAHQLLAVANRDVPAMLAEIRTEARTSIKSSRALAISKLDAIRDRTVLDIQRSRENISESIKKITLSSKHSVTDAATKSTALFREIAGQGPEKTLARGFAIVRDHEQKTITSVTQATSARHIEIQFRDGHVGVLVSGK